MFNNNRRITLIDPNPKLREEFENYFSFNRFSNDRVQYICNDTVENYKEFARLRLHIKEHIDYLFLEIDLLEDTDMDIIAKLKTKLFDTEIIIYTDQTDKDIFLKALRLGASGYLLKQIPVRGLNRYLDLIEEGGVAFSPKMLRHLVQEYNQTGNSLISQKQITSRQFDILSLFVEGKNQKEIAAILNITQSSVHYQCTKLYKRLGVRSRAEAIKVFYERKGEFLLCIEQEELVLQPNC